MNRFIYFILLSLSIGSIQGSAPTGNDNQGGVSAPAGTYSVTPASGPVLINAYTANATRVIHDLSVPSVGEIPLNWTRYHNTRPSSGDQLLGNAGSWRHGYQWEFAFTTLNNVPAIQLNYPNGTSNYFTQTSQNVWSSTSAVADQIHANGTTYTLINSSNQKYVFTKFAGQYVQVGMTFPGGLYQPIYALQPDQYLLTSIIDSTGQVTTLTYELIGMPPLATLGVQLWGMGVDYDNAAPVYEYWGLVKVTEPGGKYLTITYEPHFMNWFLGWEMVLVPKLAIASVKSSDNRFVNYVYGVAHTHSGSSYYFHYALCYARYSDSTQSSYSYNYPFQPGEETSQPIIGSYISGTISTILLTAASDPRAEGVIYVKYTYFSGAGDPAGAVSTANEGSTNTAIQAVALNANNPQAPTVTYPDGSLYQYNVGSGGLLLSVNSTINAANTYGYATSSGDWSTTVTNANSNSATITRNTTGQLLSREWPKSGSETVNPKEYWSYNGDGYLASYTDTRGNMTTFTRSTGTNLVTQVSYPDGSSEQFTYNSFSQVLTHTRRNGGIEAFIYNASGLLTSETDAMGNATTFTYDSHSWVASITDPRGNTTSFLYNDRGQAIKITYPDASFRSFTYDSAGYLLTVTNELGKVWTYTYDSLKRVSTSKDPLNRITTYSYDAAAPANRSPILTTFPDGKKVAATYNANWGYKIASITTGYGTTEASTTTYGYDAAGNLTTITDALGRVTQVGYDSRDRVSWAKDAANNQSDFHYDQAGNLIQQETADGITTNTYDAANRLIQSIDPQNQVAHLSYTSEGQLGTYTDPKGSSYEYTHDLNGRSTSLTYPDLSTEVYGYDAAGNMTSYKARNGSIQTLAYNNRNRNTTSSWNDGITPSTTKSYDVAGRLLTISNSASAISYTYNDVSDVLSETQNLAGIGPKTVTYSYSLDGSVNTLTYPDTTTLTYSYNNRSQLAAIKQGTATLVSYSYDATGNRIGKNYANGVTSTLTYDSVQRLTSIVDLTPSPAAGTPLQRFDYGYDDMSRRKYVKRNGNLGDVYGYDATGQLTSVQYNVSQPDGTPTNPLRSVSYAFDAAGNRSQLTDSSAGNRIYTTNSANQYATIDGASVSYDGQGNLQNYDGWTYTYNAFNQLIQATDGVNVLAFAYDPLGRKVKDTKNGVSSFRVYDGDWHLLSEYDGTGTRTARYVHGANTDEIISKTDASNVVVYYHTDGLGNVTKLTSATGAILEQYEYDIYGNVTISDAAGNVIFGSNYDNRFLFTGREWMPLANLYDYRHRVYSPNLGRFLQPDPIGHGGDPYNIYRYCNNDPINSVDPSGLGHDDLFGAREKNPGYYLPIPEFAALTPTITFGSNSNTSDFSSSNWVPGIVVAAPGMTYGSGSFMSDWVSRNSARQALGYLGFIPGPIGMAASGLEAVINLSEGDYVAAGISVAAMVPFAKIAIHGAKAAKLAKIAKGSMFSSSLGSGGSRATAELLGAMRAHGRTITIATRGSEELRFLNAVGAEASVGGAGRASIILRENPSKVAAIEEFLHGTQERLGIIERRGIQGAEDHVADFMERHRKLLGLDH